MRTSLALAFTSVLALSAPALAQSSTDTGGSALPMSGHNPPGSGAVQPGDPAPGYYNNNGLNEGRAAAPDVDAPRPMRRDADE